MLKDLLAKYYQDNKERLQKRRSKNIKVFSKKKSNNMGMSEEYMKKQKLFTNKD